MSDGKSLIDCVTQYDDLPECNWRRTFYPNACHLCKKYGDLLKKGQKLKRCAGCGLITYCGKEHQQSDWPKHKDVCKVVSKILKKSSAKSIFQLMGESPVTDDRWVKLKVSLLEWIGCKLGRELEKFEREIFLFPRNCAVCHDTDPEKLFECQECLGYSLCVRHAMRKSEGHFCHDMLLCKKMDLLEDKSFKTLPKQLNNIIKLRGCMTDILQPEPDEPERIATYEMPFKIGHTDLISDPITLLYALRLLNFKYQEVLRVHVIGATADDVRSSWHILLHHEEQILNYVLVTFIGKNLPDIEEYECNECTDRAVFLRFQHQRRTYRDFISDESFTEPHIVVGFCMGVPEHEEFGKNEEAWSDCLEAVAKRNCPVVFTFHYEKSADELENRVAICCERFEKFYRGFSTFNSLRPRRDYELERPYYRNCIITIYKLKDK